MQPEASISSTIQYQSRDGRGVAIADSLEGHGGATRQRLQEGTDGPGDVVDAGAVYKVPFGVQHSKHRIVLACPGGLAGVGITTDRIIGVEHAAPPVSRQGFDTPSLPGGAVLSYNHLARWDRERGAFGVIAIYSR
jgi:hypothetical protein